MNENAPAPTPDFATTPLLNQHPWRETLLIAITLLAIGWAYFGAIPAGFGKPASRPYDYYGLLTEAFLAGQFHLKIDTDPRLLTLENPYAGAQGANRPHDMSYYRGRFYLYYGASPVLLLFLPWRCLTGTYMGEAMGTMLMLYGGILLAAAWLIAARRRWFPDLAIGWLLLLILVVGFSPPLFTEATNITFYAVPISCAFFCLMAAFTGASLALSRKTPAAKAGWLATASLFWGLAVAARPIYVLGLTILAIPAVWLWWNSERATRWRWSGLRMLAATVVPAALVGAAMMFYNYMRFDSPFDFGIRFSMATGDLREARLVGAEFIPKNLFVYLIKPAALIRYYPFIIPNGDTWGILPHLPFVALAVLFPLTWINPSLRRRQWVLAGVLLMGAAAANFSLLCLFFGEQDRYLVDFVPPLLLLAAVCALAALDAARQSHSRFLPWIVRILVSGLAGYAIFTGLMLALPRHAGTRNLLWFERLANTPTSLLETQAGTPQGPLELEVYFPRNRVGATEPLLTTGYGNTGGDSIAVHYLDETHVRFQAFHVGRGGPVSEPVEIDFGVPHRIRISLGSLYPPRGHPVFSHWLPSQVEAIRRRLKIELDSQPVLQGNFPVYPSTPPGIRVGRSELPPDISAPAFTGKILVERRLGIDSAAAAGYERSEGPVRLTLRFPPRVGDEGLPLVATGDRGDGDLLFAQLLDNGLIRFGHDSFGAGAVLSPAVPFDPNLDQVVEVEMGSLYPPDARPASSAHKHRLRVVFSGIALLDTVRPFKPSDSDDVEFGFNTVQASTAIDYFPGAIRRVERINPAPPLDPKEQLSRWGPLRLVIEFPQVNLSPVEPLLVTGHTGRADVLFVRYESADTIRLGLDHWSVGSAISDPIKLDRAQPQMLEVWSGALFPTTNDPAWRGLPLPAATQLQRRFEVRLNGRTVFTPEFSPYPAVPGEISLGENLIGASTCDMHFSGRFLLVERIPWQEPRGH